MYSSTYSVHPPPQPQPHLRQLTLSLQISNWFPLTPQQPLHDQHLVIQLKRLLLLPPRQEIPLPRDRPGVESAKKIHREVGLLGEDERRSDDHDIQKKERT